MFVQDLVTQSRKVDSGVEFKRYIDGIIAAIVRLDATADDVVLANADGKTAFSSRPTEDCDVGGNSIGRCNHRI